MDMKPEKQRLVIAELTGWVLKWQNRGGGELHKEKPSRNAWEVWFHPTKFKFREEIFPPDCHGDRQVWVELLESIPDREWDDFQDQLEFVTSAPGRRPHQRRKDFFNATPPQISEAYLRYKDKWEETE